jgi:hypothetical protein
VNDCLIRSKRTGTRPSSSRVSLLPVDSAKAIEMLSQPLTTEPQAEPTCRCLPPVLWSSGCGAQVVVDSFAADAELAGQPRFRDTLGRSPA